MRLHNSNLKKGLYIGFGGEFYTLWNVDYPDDYGTQMAHYMGNVSKDLEEAKKMYPDATVSSLKGETWTPFESQLKQTTELSRNKDTKFWFGKYVGKMFSEVEDTDYLLWFYRKTDGVAKPLFNELISRGLIYIEGTFCTKRELDCRHLVEQTTKDGWKKIEFTSNFDECECIMVKVDGLKDLMGDTHGYYNDSVKVQTVGLELTEKYYNGYTYKTLVGVATMKKGSWMAEFRGGDIVSIRV